MSTIAKAFKRSQIVRLSRLHKRGLLSLPAGLRCNVMATRADGNVKVTIRDPEYPTLSGQRVLVPTTRLESTQRGRPLLEVTKVPPMVIYSVPVEAAL